MMEIINLLEFTERAQLREWLMANHATVKRINNAVPTWNNAVS